MKTSLLISTVALSLSSQVVLAKMLKKPTHPMVVAKASERIIPGINLVCYEPGNVRLLRLEQDTWQADTGKLLSSSASLLILDQTGSQDQLATGERIASGTYEFKMDGIAVEVTIPSRQLSLQCGFDGESIPMP